MDLLTAAAALAVAGVMAGVLPRAAARIRLSRAKHPSMAGHPRISRRMAALIPHYDFGADEFFASDGAGTPLAERRQTGFFRLADRLNSLAPVTSARIRGLMPGVSDLQFTDRFRVPFQYSRFVRDHLPATGMVSGADHVRVHDLDGNAAYDLTGSYGLNVFGYDFYRECIGAGAEKVQALGPVLGAYHPIIEDNVRRLCAISGLDEVSFHMSGTEAVMQAVRLARYHTTRPRVVRFCGAYHGWWDGVQPGIGNPRPVPDTYTLREMDARTLRVLDTRRDIACVLVNPLQALHPNAAAPADGTLVASDRTAAFDRDAYAVWLRALREVCTRRGIVLIFDEVFVGFRIAYGGAQEYFGVRADLVTYGKTVGGGLPVGVLCGRSALMRRFDPDRPADICFARGTFNSHPYVMGAMHEFLTRLPGLRDHYAELDTVWNARRDQLNARLSAAGLPVRAANLTSVWTICYTTPSRYNWMLQYYLRAEGLALSWVGTGRLIFSHSYSDTDFAGVADRFVCAATAMALDGWWNGPAVTNRDIRRQITREMLRARLGRRRTTGQAASGPLVGAISRPPASR